MRPPGRGRGTGKLTGFRKATGPALATLETAIKAGFRNWDWIDKDPDLSKMIDTSFLPADLQK